MAFKYPIDEAASKRRLHICTESSGPAALVRQGENAAGLYACSAYYLSNVVLELLINSVNGAVFAFILYECVDFQVGKHTLTLYLMMYIRS